LAQTLVHQIDRHSRIWYPQILILVIFNIMGTAPIEQELEMNNLRYTQNKNSVPLLRSETILARLKLQFASGDKGMKERFT